MHKKSEYPQHSIGEHIVHFPLTFQKSDSVEKVLDHIQNKKESWPFAENIFVLDKNKKLIGRVEFKSILASNRDKSLAEIMETDFDKLTDHTHQSTVIKLASNRGVENMPVTNHEGEFLGVVDTKQIFKIMHEEHIDKLMHFSGILENESLISGYNTKTLTVVKSRLPWLFFGLMGGIVATLIVEKFSHTLEEQLALAFFIPVIVYMNAAVGTQAQTIFVRYSSLEKTTLIRSLLSEVKVSLLIGIFLAAFIFIFTSIWINLTVASIVALSMFIGIVGSAVIGISIPTILQKLGKDPAIGSGPFTTIIQDIFSITIYFLIATTLL